MAVVMIPPQVLRGLPNVFTQPQTMSRLNSTGDMVISPDGISRWIFEAGNLLIATGSGFWTNPEIQFSGSVTLNAAAYGGVPASSNPTIASGAVYQNTTGRYVYLYIPVTYSPTTTAAATAAFALGPSSTPATIFTNSEPAGIAAGRVDTLTLSIPPGWYYSLTVANATIGTPTEVQQ